MPLLLNSAIVWETLSVLQMKYSGKYLLLFFAVRTFKCLGDRDKNWIKNPCAQSVFTNDFIPEAAFIFLPYPMHHKECRLPTCELLLDSLT